MHNNKLATPSARVLCGVLALAISPFVLADHDETPFGAAVIIIELTDNDIELQVFADAFDWTRLEIFDPRDRKVFDTKARGRLKRQGGMSEMFWASEPSHYLVEEDNFDEPVAAFLARWPEGEYDFEGRTTIGVDLESEAYLSHVLAALPEIVAPLPVGDEPPVVDVGMPLLIDWEPVTTRFIGDGPVEIFEYQVIIDQVDPERIMAWVDGGTRSALINVPPDVTELTVPPEFLLPGTSYEFEVLAIEASGNSSISVGEFDTSD
jgi:hypothetical protein